MSLKAKLASTIAAVCMVICLLSVGIWAASNGTVTLGGTVSFTAEDVNVTVTGTVADAAVNTWTNTSTIDADDEDGVNYDWDNIALSFVQDGNNLKAITITIAVTNNGSEPVTVAIADDANNTHAASIELAYSNGGQVAGGATENYTITITAVKDASTTITSANWGSVVTIAKA